jgi:hypothetical protein
LKNVVFWDVTLCRSWVTNVSEERIASIFRVEKSSSWKPASTGGCRLSLQSEITSYIRTRKERLYATWEINRE